MAKFFNRSGLWMGVFSGALVLGAGVTMYSANALPLAAQAQPTKVGLVDMTVLINELDELKDRNAGTTQLREQYQKELTAEEQQIKLLEDDVKAGAQAGQTMAQIDKVANLQERKAMLKLRADKNQSVLELRNTQNIRELYTKALTAIEQVAKMDGYDLVLLDDRPVQLSPGGNSAVLNDEILKKRVLFANNANVDITQRILTVMQNDYAAGKAAGTNK